MEPTINAENALCHTRRLEGTVRLIFSEVCSLKFTNPLQIWSDRHPFGATGVRGDCWERTS